MKIGAENRKVAIAAVILMVIAVVLFVRMVRGWTSVSASAPSPTAQRAADLAEAAATTSPTTSSRGRQRRPAPPLPTLNPRLRLDLLAQSENMKYEGTGRNPFDPESLPPIPTPTAPPIKKGPETPQPTPTYTQPIAPRIPLKFFGVYTPAGEPKQAMLMQAEDVFVAKEGDIVNRRYKVVRINATSIEMEDMLTNSRQTIPLTQG